MWSHSSSIHSFGDFNNDGELDFLHLSNSSIVNDAFVVERYSLDTNGFKTTKSANKPGETIIKRTKNNTWKLINKNRLF